MVTIGQFYHIRGTRDPRALVPAGRRPAEERRASTSRCSARTGLDDALQRLARELSSQYKVVYGRPQSLIPPERTEVSSARAGVTMRGAPARGESGA